MRVFTVPSFNVLSGCFYVSLTLVAALPVWILINFVKQLLLVKPICSYFFPEGWHTRLMRGLRCARSRVRPPVRSHPCFNFSWNTLKTEHWWREVCVEGRGEGAGVKWGHRRPQVYQLLLSRVVDVKYGCFTFTFTWSQWFNHLQISVKRDGGSSVSVTQGSWLKKENLISYFDHAHYCWFNTQLSSEWIGISFLNSHRMWCLKMKEGPK